ncbi:MAG: Ribonuclease BN, partial [uncultured Nocardioidaceae bacterium]
DIAGGQGPAPRRRRGEAAGDTRPWLDADPQALREGDQRGPDAAHRGRCRVLLLPLAVSRIDRCGDDLRAGGGPADGPRAERGPHAGTSRRRRLADHRSAQGHHRDAGAVPGPGSAGRLGLGPLQRLRRRRQHGDRGEPRLRRGGDPRLRQAQAAVPGTDSWRDHLHRHRRRADRGGPGAAGDRGAQWRGILAGSDRPLGAAARRDLAGAIRALPACAGPRRPAVQVGLGRCSRRDRAVAGRLGRFLGLRQQLRQLRQDVRRPGWRRRPPAVAVDHQPRGAPRGGDQRRGRAADRGGHHHRRATAARPTRRSEGRHRSGGPRRGRGVGRGDRPDAERRLTTM